MASFVYIDPVITINGVDLSGRIKKAALKVGAEDKENTAFGSAWKTRLGGLKDGTIELEFNQDHAASQVDATIWPLLGVVTPVTIKPTVAAVSATNPNYTGNVLVKEYAPMDGAVGDVASTSVSWPTSGTLARATT